MYSKLTVEITAFEYEKRFFESSFSLYVFFFFFQSHLKPIDPILTILPVVTKDLPISPRCTLFDYLSRCKFSNLTTRQPMVEFHSLTHVPTLSVTEEKTQILLW